ncbi:unnamed protein product [Candidula unifasciata]|uniref:Ubiquinol-cytochrome c chaperone domain-containing protein n=1 Tax=Candidula unifasciata TaxID=100452 RepID=A0A8S3ZK01_9EUPU|nr:unnamed protein product [Candidula unifasciata]
MKLLGRSFIASSIRLLSSRQPKSLFSTLKYQTFPQCSVCNYKQITQLSCTVIQQRYVHTPTIADQESMSPWQRIKLKMGFHGKLQYPKMRLVLSGCNLYICCTDCIDFSEFVKVLNIPDTFNSWFLLLQLHLWMVNVKVSQMGQEGAILKENMYKSMWQNVEQRLQKFQDLTSSDRKEAMENYRSLMFLSILYYDEGLMGSDKQLANSLWVQLFAMDPNIGAEQLELMVKYVRKQVYHHDSLDPLLILKPGYISFLPLVSDKLDPKKVQRDLHYVTDKQ